LLEGFHKHHVIPRHLGGTDDPSNLVLLHPYDHAIAHFVRWKIYKTHGDAWAYNKLIGVIDKGAHSVKGMKHSEEVKIKIGKASAERKRKPHSEETKRLISEKKKGKPSNRKGVKLSEETRKKISDSHIGQEAWNKGLKGAQVAWNKGLKGLPFACKKRGVGLIKWSEEAKQRHSEKIKEVWARRKGVSL
jgi:hypothetical protein